MKQEQKITLFDVLTEIQKIVFRDNKNNIIIFSYPKFVGILGKKIWTQNENGKLSLKRRNIIFKSDSISWLAECKVIRK